MNARPNKNLILQYMRDDDIAGDPWGTGMAWGFAIAEVLHGADEDVPDELEFVPSPFVAVSDERPEEWPDVEVWDLLHNGEITVSDLQTAGKCLHLYIELARQAGRDY